MDRRFPSLPLDGLALVPRDQALGNRAARPSIRWQSLALLVACAAVVVGASACPTEQRECEVNADCAAIERCTPQGDCVLIDEPAPEPSVAPEPEGLDGGAEPEGLADAGIPPGGDVDGGGLLPPPDAVQIDRIELVPGDGEVPVGTTVVFLVIGHADDGAMYDVTLDSTWSSSDPAVVSMDADGRAACGTTGTVVVTASAFGQTTTASITVTPAEPLNLQLTPTQVVLAATQSVQVRAFSDFTDGQEREMTDVVTWATEDGTVATVDDGIVLGVQAGATNLVALFNGFSANAPIVVEAAPLVSIELDTADDGINAGLLATFTAEGTFSDDEVDDVTNRLVWSTSNNVIARGIPGSPGVIRTLAEGTVDVIATDPATGVQGRLTLNIGAVRLISVALRDKHVLAGKTDGTVWGWGDNRFGQLGQALASQCGGADGERFSCATSAVLIPNLPIIRAVGAGNQQSLAIDETGKVWAWGNDAFGQLGRGTFGGAINPTPAYVIGEDDTPLGSGVAEDPGKRITQVSSGFIHCLALSAEGKVYAWGAGGQGRLGLGDEESRNRATEVDGLPPIVFVHAGQFQSVAVDDERRLWTWGSNGDGQQGFTGDSQRVPRLVPGAGGENLFGAASGWAHTATLNGAGEVHAVGRGTEGQLGRGTFVNSSTLSAATVTGAVRVFAGNLHMGALLGNGRVVMWGYGPFGQLGNGDSVSSATPVTVLGPGTAPELLDIQAVFGGSDHMIAVGNDLTMYAWGRNENGQLGIGAWSVGDFRTRPVVLPPF